MKTPAYATAIPSSDWKWYGKSGHFICGEDCRFHLCTLVGEFLVSTVGEYLPDSSVRDILASSRGTPLEGKGDNRRADWMRKFGYEDIGYDCKYETMVFRAGPACKCGCEQPTLASGHDLDFTAYNKAGDAARGHYAMCEKWAAKKLSDPDVKSMLEGE